MALVLIPTLVPLNYMQGKGATNGVQGLDRLSWANVGLAHTDRYWAHLTLAMAVILYVCWTVWGELETYIAVRHENCQSFANTLLVCSVPDELLSVRELEKRFSSFPGGVRRIWFNRNLTGLVENVKLREKIAAALEASETKLIQGVLKAHRAGKCRQNYRRGSEPLWHAYMNPEEREKIRVRSEKCWPSALPRWFSKTEVDAIDFYRREYARLTAEIELDRSTPERFPLLKSAFIQFNAPVAAHMACQTVMHHTTDHLTPRHLEKWSDNVLWHNLSIGWWASIFNTTWSHAAIITLAVLCVVPATFAGLLSQVIYLTKVAPWLGWLGRLPDWLLGLIQGVLPPSFLAALLAFFSASLRFLALKQGLKSETAVELLIQRYYFIFLFVQVTLIVSLSAGLTTIVDEAKSGISSLPATLAKNLPKASNYFFSYVLLQALSVTANTLLQIGTLVDRVLLSPLLDHTVTQKWRRQGAMTHVQWGIFVPVHTNLACIGLLYSVISPLILLLEVLAFGLFWFVYRYHLLYVAAIKRDNSGVFYPRAIIQLLYGLYLMEASLLGLFILVRDPQNRAMCVGQATVMGIAVIATVLYHWILYRAFDPLLEHMPTCLETAVGTIHDSQSFQHAALSSKPPTVRIPKDPLGISKDEIKQTKTVCDNLEINDGGATIDINGKIRIKEPPYEI